MPQSLRTNFAFVKLLLAIPCLLLLHSAIAQTKYGFNIGGGKTSLYKFAVAPEDFDRYSGQTSWWVGLNVDKALIKNKLHLFIAGTYNTKGYKYLLHNETGTPGSIKDSAFKQKIMYADVNLSLRKKFMFGGEDEEPANSFFFGTGPVVSFLTSGQQETESEYFTGSLIPASKASNKVATGNGPGKYKPMFFSWGFSTGVEVYNLSVWINANIGLSDYFQDAKQSLPHKIKTFGVNVSYTFYNHKPKEREEKAPREKHNKHNNVPVIAIDSLKDSDGDGIADVLDKCPGHKGTAKYGGCPIPDTDGDGVNDDNDKCIDIAGLASNNGCPVLPDTVVIKPVQKDTAFFMVYFEPGKSILRSEAYTTLTKVVDLLKANPKLVVVLKGHTDNVGSEDANYKRSLLRATVCADYISSFYIDKSRLTTLSLGNKMPAASLTDPLLQWKNRRVEIFVFEGK